MTYVGALGGCLAFVVTRFVVLRLWAGPDDVDLHPIEVAYLVGESEHALLVAGVALHDAGALRPLARAEGVRLTREQVLSLAPDGCVVDTAATPAHPLERAIVRSLGTGSGRPLADRRLLEHPELSKLGERLTRLGLIMGRRRAWLVRLSALWPVAVLGILLVWLDGNVGGAGPWLSIGAAVVVTLAGMLFGVPRQLPAARRAVQQAAAHRRDLAEMLAKRLETVGFGTDDAELREAGCDPRVVAAHGAIVLWSADPLLAVALGAVPPGLGRRRRGRFPHEPLDSSPYITYAQAAGDALN